MKLTETEQESLAIHKTLRGKIGSYNKMPLKTTHDLSLAYTPGVAAPCLAIAEDESLTGQLTLKGNAVAVVSDGSAVLGLGNICLLYTSPSPRDQRGSRMPSSA